MVPRKYVITLMRSCAALINPSFFEGWSSTVEEARAFGVPMLLSDIELHHEQMADEAIYFNPANAKDLAVKLYRAYSTSNLSIPKRNLTEYINNGCRFAFYFAAAIDRMNRESRLLRTS